jgi:hypothetical protein
MNHLRDEQFFDENQKTRIKEVLKKEIINCYSNVKLQEFNYMGEVGESFTISSIFELSLDDLEKKELDSSKKEISITSIEGSFSVRGKDGKKERTNAIYFIAKNITFLNYSIGHEELRIDSEKFNIELRDDIDRQNLIKPIP